LTNFLTKAHPHGIHHFVAFAGKGLSVPTNPFKFAQNVLVLSIQLIILRQSGYTLQDHNVAVSRFSKRLSNTIPISCLVLLGLNLWGKSSKQND
jgi:hypothetical protein